MCSVHLFSSNGNTRQIQTSISVHCTTDTTFQQIEELVKGHDDFPWSVKQKNKIELTTVGVSRTRWANADVQPLLLSLVANVWSNTAQMHVVPTNHWNCSLSWAYQKAEINLESFQGTDVHCLMEFTIPNVTNFSKTWIKYQRARNQGMCGVMFVQLVFLQHLCSYSKMSSLREMEI